MLFDTIKIRKFSVVIHVYIFFKSVGKSKLLLEFGLQIQYIKIMGLIINIFNRKLYIYIYIYSSNIHRYESYTLKHYKNKEKF